MEVELQYMEERGEQSPVYEAAGGYSQPLESSAQFWASFR